MHHELDTYPIPADVFYINELSLVGGKVPCETRDTMAKAIAGKKTSEGGIFWDDNVSIYVPKDLNVDTASEELILQSRL